MRWALLLLWASPVGVLACGPLPLTEAQTSAATAAASAVDRAALQAHVAAIVDARRLDFSSSKRLSSSAYVEAELLAAGLEVVHDTSEVAGKQVDNLYADIPGQSDEQVILMAHYDALSAGADDNASGLAVLLEAARIFAGAPAPRRTLRLLAVDREEEGQIGSTEYVARHRSDDVCAFITLDMVAYADSRPGTQDSLPGLDAPDAGDFIAVIGNAPSERLALWSVELSGLLPVSSSAVGLLLPGDGISWALGDTLRSDHAPFWFDGIPGVFFTDTADFRNPYYHTTSDLPGTLDDQFFAGSAALIIGSVAAYLERCGR